MSDSTIPLKKCTKCGEEKPATAEYFSRHKKAKDGLNWSCKECEKPGYGERKIQREALNKLTIEGLKRCTKCGEAKPATTEYFQRDSGKQSGLASHCKECKRATHVECRESSIEYYHSNKDRIRERHRTYFETHRNELRIKAKQRYDANRDVQRVKYKEWRKQNAAKIKEAKRRYHQQNRHLAKLAHQRRRARKNNLPSDIKPVHWQLALDYFHGCCAVCGRPPGLWHTLAADHWIPLNDPRPDNPGTVPWNIVPLCHGQDGCNNSKKDLPPERWLSLWHSKRKTLEILGRIQVYFEWIKQQ